MATPSPQPTQPTQAASRPRSLDFCVEDGAPVFVAAATLCSAFLGSTVGALTAVAKRQSPIHIATSAAVSSGVAGLAFFGTREYLVSPVLVGLGATKGHVRRARGDADAAISSVRTERVLDSGIAGALAGGGLSFGLPFTSALIAVLAQFGVNEVRVQRLKMLARRAGETPTPTPAAEGDSSINLPELSGTVADAMANPAKPAGARRGDAPLTQRVLDALTNVLPIRRISDDEFVATMEKRNGEIEKRLAEIEREQAALFERAAAKEGETK